MPSFRNRPPTLVLFAGQLHSIKGVHTAIEAFVRVASTQHGEDLSLTICGREAFDPGYEDRLRGIVSLARMQHRVRFLGQIPRENLHKIYHEHDIFLFSSEWNEPFSIGLLEAMAAGLAIVTTMTGGTPEIIRPEENALCYPAGDVELCSASLSRFVTNQSTFDRLRRAARQTIEGHYFLPRMIEQVEETLQQIAGEAKPSK
jgi:glycosyltransferase involved in cell wall biosynthesis